MVKFVVTERHKLTNILYLKHSTIVLGIGFPRSQKTGLGSLPEKVSVSGVLISVSGLDYRVLTTTLVTGSQRLSGMSS